MVRQFIHKINPVNVLWYCVPLLLLSSCRVSEPIRLPATTPVPTSFTGSTDSTSIGNLDWKGFFADPDLESLIDTALARNPDLQIATQRIEVARANFEFTRGALMPSVNAVGAAGVDRYGRYTLNGVGNYDTNLSPNIDGKQRIPDATPEYFLGFRSNWEIDLWGKLRNRKRAAYIRFLASEKGRHLITTSLISEVARQYYSLLGLDSELAIIRENAELQQRAVELVAVQKAAGRVTELAVQQFNAQLINTRSLEAQVQQQIVETENQLNQLLGRFPQPIPRSKTLTDQALPAQVSAGVPSQMLRRRPDIQQAELAMQAANIDIDVARAEFLPSLNLTPYIGLNSFRASVLLDPASLALGALGSLSAPVFNRRYIKSNYNLSIAQSREAFYNYRKTVLTGFSEVMTSLRGIENYRKVADLQTQEVAVLNQAATISDELFATGYANYLEVITAQRSVLTAELSLINTKRAQFLSLIDLYRALGGGWQ
ncbi:NodT family efflux transporter outer membrane factor (OMF) lipoprotein [Larkinella arboricola]|uniref:NodT family efflux transporter outer membrane factor (OMF) lipoprotein n=1 Tax=Larkinella arboricola TaxID=643671 RepID=A0A327WSI1_LARAB|nr:TolC family protein [Larkinella arboricola]RAJ95652.1 NodT family efflux transporter outer membrane factor (OMF) lipoprotein [Larkinella arboricola]